jgi:hypothetical protein
MTGKDTRFTRAGNRFREARTAMRTRAEQRAADCRGHVGDGVASDACLHAEEASETSQAFLRVAGRG